MWENGINDSTDPDLQHLRKIKWGVATWKKSCPDDWADYYFLDWLKYIQATIDSHAFPDFDWSNESMVCVGSVGDDLSNFCIGVYRSFEP